MLTPASTLAHSGLRSASKAEPAVYIAYAANVPRMAIFLKVLTSRSCASPAPPRPSPPHPSSRPYNCERMLVYYGLKDIIAK